MPVFQIVLIIIALVEGKPQKFQTVAPDIKSCFEMAEGLLDGTIQTPNKVLVAGCAKIETDQKEL